MFAMCLHLVFPNKVNGIVDAFDCYSNAKKKKNKNEKEFARQATQRGGESIENTKPNRRRYIVRPFESTQISICGQTKVAVLRCATDEKPLARTNRRSVFTKFRISFVIGSCLMLVADKMVAPSSSNFEGIFFGFSQRWPDY